MTVFGESAGSINAGLLLCSPLAAGLFQRVILESGPVLSLAHHPASLETGERFGETVSRSLGPPGNLQKLREATPENVVQAAREAATHGGDPGFVLDGWCLEESPAKIFAEGRQMPVDLMIGNNGREISVFRDTSGTGENRGLGGDSVKETIRMFYGRATPLVGGLYLADSTLHRTEAADAWINDVVCTCPEMAMAILYAETGDSPTSTSSCDPSPERGRRCSDLSTAWNCRTCSAHSGKPPGTGCRLSRWTLPWGNRFRVIGPISRKQEIQTGPLCAIGRASTRRAKRRWNSPSRGMALLGHIAGRRFAILRRAL